MTQTEQYRQFLQEYPPQTEREKIYVSLVLAVSERMDKLQKGLMDMGTILLELRRKVATEPAGPRPPSAPEEMPRDATPFPAGVQASVGVTPSTLDAVVGAAVPVAPPVPNASSGPAVNASPIPSKGKNGGKGVSA